jgi:hypothetical protein
MMTVREKLGRDQFHATETTENENENLYRSRLPASSPNGDCGRISPLECRFREPQPADNVDTKKWIAAATASQEGGSGSLTRIGTIEILKTLRLALIVEHDTYERSIDVKSAVVLDESELPEFVHEKIHPRASGTNHFSQSCLGYDWQRTV